MLRRITRHRLFVPALIGAAVLAAALAWLSYKTGTTPAHLAAETTRYWREEQPVLKDWAISHPVLTPLALYLAVAILPTFVLPVSPLLALCGALLGPGWGLLVAGLGVMSNSVLTFGIARRFRLWVEPRVLRAGYRVPKLSGDNLGMVIVPMRVVPGIPLVFQNYLLGLAGAPKKPFLGWVLAIETPCAAPYVLVGAGAMQGRSDLMLTGGGLLLAVAIAAKIFGRRRPAATPTTETTTDARS